MQNSKSKINLKKYLGGKTITFVDYANIKAWAKEKGLAVDLLSLYKALKNSGVAKVIFYYGTDPKNPKSAAFLEKVKSFGYQVKTKRVKYIKVDLASLLQHKANQALLRKLSPTLRSALTKELDQLRQKGVAVLIPKADFDVEISLDMVLSVSRFERFILFSGDGDFAAAIRIVRRKGGKVLAIAGRKYLSGEIITAANRFMRLETLRKRGKRIFVSLKEKTRGEPWEKSNYFIPEITRFVKGEKSPKRAKEGK